MQTIVPEHHLKPPAPPETFEYKNWRQGEFWRAIPKYAEVDERTFLDHIWQGQNSVKSPEELLETVKDLVAPSFFDDAREGFRRAPMAVRVSPYMIASIDWNDPYDDPIRTQFIPLASRLLPDQRAQMRDAVPARPNIRSIWTRACGPPWSPPSTSWTCCTLAN